jgi:uncharacterized protein
MAGPVSRRGDAGVGIGLRQPHYEQALEQRADLAFVEVIAENFFAPGGATRAVLRRARELYPVSLHGVGLGLARAMHSGGAAVLHANDLLPVAFTPAALDIMVRNVGVVQERLRRPILVENLSAYLAFADDAMSEAEFLVALCQRSGCRLLLDVNNLMVNAVNAAAFEPVAMCCDVVDSLPHESVGEIHLAGYSDTDEAAIDDHGSRVRPDVWQVYRHALRRFGPVPSLIEWDTDVPPFDVLLDEADRAVAWQAGDAP